jgi:single-strand DNA-binding protein
MAENSVTLVGNLTREPELRFTTGGRGVASFGLAVSRRYQVNGEWQEQTSFFNVVAWGTLGENAAASLGKGTRVVVTGRLEQRSYETKEGEKRSVVESMPTIALPALGAPRSSASAAMPSSGGDGGSSSSGSSSGSSGSSGGAPRNPDPVYGDEEPF